MGEMHRMKIGLEKELEERQTKIDILTREKRISDEKCNKFESLYDESAGRVAELQKQPLETDERFEQLGEQDFKMAEVARKLEAAQKAWDAEREHMQKERFDLEKRIEYLTSANHVNCFQYSLKIDFFQSCDF